MSALAELEAERDRFRAAAIRLHGVIARGLAGMTDADEAGAAMGELDAALARSTDTEDELIGKHYAHDYQGVRLDPYRILQVYGITHPAHQHAIKKLLRAGRSSKPLETDLREVIHSIERYLDMLSEDGVAE